MAGLKDPYNVLYIDGNDTRRKQISSRLRMQAFNVELAQNGFHSIHLVEKHPFDLVITVGDDFEDMPTAEVACLIRNVQSRDELPILALLTEEDDDEAASLAESGVNDIVIYKGNFNQVLAEIEKIQKLYKKKK